MHLHLHLDLCNLEQTDPFERNCPVIYDSVWSDPSDPSKTYHNAAQAVLAKLHRRAGITAMLESHQPLAP